MSIIWGIPYLLIKVAVGGVPVPVLVLARVGVGSALLLPVAISRKQIGALLPHWRWLLAFACVEIVAPWLLLSEAERKLSSSMSGLLVASVPIVVVVLARLTGGTDRLNATRGAGLLGGPGRGGVPRVGVVHRMRPPNRQKGARGPAAAGDARGVPWLRRDRLRAACGAGLA